MHNSAAARATRGRQRARHALLLARQQELTQRYGLPVLLIGAGATLLGLSLATLFN